MVGFNLRWHRLVRQARDIIGRNELGAIKLVRTVFTGGQQPGVNKSAWRNSPDTGGGVIFDLGVHHFDIVRFLLASEVEDVQGSTHDFDHAATVMFSMSNGARVVCGFAEGTGANQALEVYGERGWLRVSCYRADGLAQFRVNEQPGSMAARLRAAANTAATLPRTLFQARGGGEFGRSYRKQWTHFAEAVLQDKPVEADLLAGRRALEIALAVSRAK
jgi:predicted dehydrogenase